MVPGAEQEASETPMPITTTYQTHTFICTIFAERTQHESEYTYF